jgi:predicted glycosyltransferase
MTITPYPGVFEAAPQNDYRVFDKGMKKVRLPMKPYIALRITEIKNIN